MPYNSVIDRTDAGALIPEDVAREIVQNATEQSAALTLFRRVNLSRNQQRIPVLSALPTAYFVNGDTGLKQTSEVAWTNKYLNVEEIAVIVPIPENVFDDADYDVWGEVRPKIEEAIGRTLDAAVFFGTNAPAAWPTDVRSAADTAGNTAELGTSAAAAGGVVGDMDAVLEAIEADGFDATGWFADRRLRGHLRRARATDGQRLGDVSADLSEVHGDRVVYGLRGLWPQATGSTPGPATQGVLAFAGDWSQFVIGVRRDIEYKVLEEAVITDNTGAVVYNLPQQDMIALRAKFRVAWQVANPLTHEQPTEADRYPAGVLETPALA